MPDLVPSDDMIFVESEVTGRIDMVELGCPPTWVSNETVVCGSEGKLVDEVIISETLVVMLVDRTPGVASISELVSHGALVSTCPDKAGNIEVIAQFSLPKSVNCDVDTFALPVEISCIDTDKLGCTSAWVINDVMFCESKEV